ncbi:MAG: 2-succinyl-5-enolpyruvyl-6-hydroxy-3-cyclohexene-1-carboxylic-acid synthase [Cryobacterium sp.]|nr:2-succinyl-5-enolpyruvyl-6-hydroxy-3-cyclohexene-1-carboxylic-acid synthase [Cryobacterium sp.]
MTEPRDSATEFAVDLLTEFANLGVRDVVVSPGSRSQALALAAAALEQAGTLQLHVHIDERSAGFVALGLAIESRMPVLVVTTSGSAVANLHPAVLEAFHSAVPLILLTADRPDELRGIGANQATHQVGLFGESTRFVRDVHAPSGAAASGSHGAASPGSGSRELAREAFSAAAGHSSAAGPVQLNLAFRDPLSGPIGELPDVVPDPLPAPVSLTTAVAPAPYTVVIAGHAAGPDAEAVAHALGAPLLAEVTSGARFGRNLVVSYRELLARSDFGGRVRRAIVFGHPTLSREVPALLEREGVEVIVVRSGGEDFNPGRRAAQFVEALAVDEAAVTDAAPAVPGARVWLGEWVAASRAILEQIDTGLPAQRFDPDASRTDDKTAVAEFARAQLEVFRQPVTRAGLVSAVWNATWPHDRLVFAASRLIRDADRTVPGKRVSVHANRGLAGIDGTIATSVGIARASQRTGGSSAAGVTRVVLGDLAALHDVGSLLTSPGESLPRMQLVIGNDRGGTIFDKLEVAATANSTLFDRVLYTPHEVNFAGLAEAYGWEYVRAENRGELDEALTASGGRTIIETPLPR